MDFIMKTNYKLLIGLLTKAFEKSELDKAWDMWITMLPYMGKDNFIPFSKFTESHTKPAIDQSLDKEEIIKRAEKIKKQMIP